MYYVLINYPWLCYIKVALVPLFIRIFCIYITLVLSVLFTSPMSLSSPKPGTGSMLLRNDKQTFILYDIRPYIRFCFCFSFFAKVYQSPSIQWNLWLTHWIISRYHISWTCDLVQSLQWFQLYSFSSVPSLRTSSFKLIFQCRLFDYDGQCSDLCHSLQD